MNRFSVVLLAGILIPSLLFAQTESEFKSAREIMVEDQIRRRGVTDPKVLAAMRKIPRHRFVPEGLVNKAYADHPLPIGEGQTISQPYIVALMTAWLKLTGAERVLEIGTGSGYQAAVLSKVAKEVYTIEIKEALQKRSTALLQKLHFKNIKTRHGDGYFGWKEAAPFDGIMITAAVDHIPPPLLKQLKDGGRLILPRGNPFVFQHLTLVTRKGDDFLTKLIISVRFVPMTGYAIERTR